MRTIGLEPITVKDVILSHKRIPFRQVRMCKAGKKGSYALLCLLPSQLSYSVEGHPDVISLDMDGRTCPHVDGPSRLLA